MLRNLLKKATLDQWQWIDAQYRTQPLPDARAACVLVTMAITMILPRFFGEQRALADYPWLAQLFALVPYPGVRADLYWVLFRIVDYALWPLLCMALVLRIGVRDVGVRLNESRAAWLTYFAMLALVLPFVFLASHTHAFLRTYPKCKAAGHSLAEFAIWESAYLLQFLLLEFLFRGFLIFTLARYIGSLAIFVMVVPYAMLHFSKPFAECLGSIVAGIALGTVALRTGSIWGGVLLHCSVALSMDCLALLRSGQLPALFG